MNKENEEIKENTEPTEEKKVEAQEATVEKKAQPSVDEKLLTPQTQNKDQKAEQSVDAKTKDVKRAEQSKGSADAQELVLEMIEKVISINRITKVTKGGKKLSFSALVVVGDTRGNVGYSLSKAAEVSIAIRKAIGVAKKNMIRVPMKGTTITHEIIGQCGGSRVLLKPASEGTGVIASGAVRAVCDGAGIHNILTKCHRSNNPINVVKATIDGLSRLKTKRLQ